MEECKFRCFKIKKKMRGNERILYKLTIIPFFCSIKIFYISRVLWVT